MIINTLTVSQLNHYIRKILEYDVGPVSVEGEVSNLSRPSSGHAYFSLKDVGAQIRCVFFKNRHKKDSFDILQHGKQLVLHGTLSLYEARGDYQLIVDAIEEKGAGDLFQQFEALKKKLGESGLFAEARKRVCPKYPNTIGLITSPTGAAIRDMLTTLNRRFPLAKVYIYPSEVQGDNAPLDLISAIKQANRDKCADVLILARGGGSIEDLWAFNDEKLAYAIAESSIPLISGVGHETDFTIADFVADLRAATPTAAAEAATPDSLALIAHIERLEARLIVAITRLLKYLAEKLTYLTSRVSSPKRMLESHWQTLDYLTRSLTTELSKILAHKKHTLLQCTSKLEALSPLATLARGFSITSFQDKTIREPKDAPIGSKIQVTLNKDALICEVLEHVKRADK